MKIFYHLHVWSSGDFDANTKYIDRTIHPFIVDDVGLEIDDWPADDLFETWPEYFVTDRLKSKLAYWRHTGIMFQEITRLKKGSNFENNYPLTDLPKFWWLKIIGKAGVDDFGLWNRMYLVVSESALNLLRDNHVTHAESKEITESIDQYFASEKKTFWK